MKVIVYGDFNCPYSYLASQRVGRLIRGGVAWVDWRAVEHDCVRRSGGTIAADGGPLTTAGWRRIRTWRQDWLALPSQVIPAVIGPDQILRSGTEGLRYLAGLAGAIRVPARLPERAEPGTGRQPRAAAARAA